MRIISFMLAWLATCWLTSTATAVVTFTATTSAPRPLDALEIGDEVTIDIRISSTGSPGVHAVGAAIRGYDPDRVDFVSGQAVDSFLHDVCLPGYGCFNGIDQSSRYYENLSFPGALTEDFSPTGTSEPYAYVQFANGVSYTARNGTGALDPGLDGVIGGGDAQFRVRFRAMALGATTFAIGTDITEPYVGNAIVYEVGVVGDAKTFVSIQVIPEPGSLVLLGLGLAGLAASGRRG